jgi:hypothetical protein
MLDYDALCLIMTLVLSANNIGSDVEFILTGGSFIYIWTIEALELILVELHASLYPSKIKHF